MGSRALRVGAAAILCALTLRLFASGLPGKLLSWLTSPDTAAFLIYLETGRDVRFSPSQEAFSVDFVESPPPAAPQPTEPPLPSFSDPEMVKLYYACSVSPDIGALMEQPLNWDLTGDQPTVLILHTHSTESYTRHGEAYTETSSYRTLDDNFGIVAVQDTSLHDYPSYNGSYADARKSIKKLLEEYPTIQMVLDLHRDASGGASQMRTLTKVDGRDSAQLMIVVGTNYDTWEENLSLALKLHAQLETACPGITRPLQLRGQRFNEDLSPGGLLIEVGAAGNSHDEALTAAGELAKAIIALAKGTQPLDEE